MISYPNVKINIGLNVLRKRGDGFHDLETLFWPCYETSDVLEIVAADDFSSTAVALCEKYSEETAVPQIRQAISQDGKLMMTIARREGVDWTPEKDLCAKAYALLLADFPDLPSVKIFLEKRSPVGAGLGGGSADAAFTLLSLNKLFSLSLSESKLAEYASRLGSDCAFFIYNRPMFGEGRGEILTEYDSSILDGFKIKLLIPDGISVSTAEAYRGVCPSIPKLSLRSALSSAPQDWKGMVNNDFESSVFKLHPQLAALKASLYEEGAIYASMSGSGSALFGIFPETE